VEGKAAINLNNGWIYAMLDFFGLRGDFCANLPDSIPVQGVERH
jgi:hypothetical protein